MKSCSVCGGVYKAKNLCSRHYAQVSRYGKVLEHTIQERRPAVIEGDVAYIPIGKGGKDGFAKVDSDMAYISKSNWSKASTGYPQSGFANTRILMHHMIIGNPPPGMVTDHINRDKMDNRRANLRVTSKQVNSINRDVQSNNTSGYSGVSYVKKTKQWRARIKIMGKEKHLGQFKTKEDAIAARRTAEEILL